MKIVFKGRGSIQGSLTKEAYLLEEGKLYEALDTSTDVNGVHHYSVTVEKAQKLCALRSGSAISRR